MANRERRNAIARARYVRAGDRPKIWADSPADDIVALRLDISVQNKALETLRSTQDVGQYIAAFCLLNHLKL